VNFRVTLTQNLWPLPRFVLSAALHYRLPVKML